MYDISRKSRENATYNSANFKYTPTRGNEELRGLIAERHNRVNGTAYDADNVLITAGATGALTATYTALLGEDRDNVVVPSIHYPTYSLVPQILGQDKYETRTVDLVGKDFNLDLEQLVEKLDSKSVLVLNSPSNPTGAVIRPIEMRQIASLAKEMGALVISDEVYSEIYFGDRPESIAKYAPERTVVMDSLSKSGLIPGMRIGWAVAPSDLIGGITKAHQFTNSCVNSVAQAAAISVLKNPEQFENLRRYLVQNQKDLANVFARNAIAAYSDGGIYVFADISNLGTSVDVSRRILEETDVVSVPGKAFGDAGDNYLRFSFGVDRAALKEGIKRLDSFF